MRWLPDPAGELTAIPQTSSWNKGYGRGSKGNGRGKEKRGTENCRRKGRKRRSQKGVGRGKEREEGKEKEGKGPREGKGRVEEGSSSSSFSSQIRQWSVESHAYSRACRLLSDFGGRTKSASQREHESAFVYVEQYEHTYCGHVWCTEVPPLGLESVVWWTL